MTRILTRPLNDRAVMDLLAEVQARAAAAGLNVAVCVTDDHGEPLGSFRMHHAHLDTPTVAQQKSTTAARKHVDTRELTTVKAYDVLDILAAQRGNPHFQHWGGGVVLVNGVGTVIGGIGVSGATPEQDHALAAAEEIPAA